LVPRTTSPDAIVTQELGGPDGLFDATGALQEIPRVLWEHGTDGEGWHDLYSRFAREGWTPNARPPGRDGGSPAELDRYALGKIYDAPYGKVTVALEFDCGELWAQLLRLRRGSRRGVLHAGVLICGGMSQLRAIRARLRVCERWFAELAILLVAPSGHEFVDS
jgi:hypothetical protein